MTLHYISRMSPAEASAREQARDRESTAAGYAALAVATAILTGAVSVYRGAPLAVVSVGGGVIVLSGLAAAVLELREARRLRKHAGMLAAYAAPRRSGDSTASRYPPVSSRKTSSCSS